MPEGARFGGLPFLAPQAFNLFSLPEHLPVSWSYWRAEE
jgi:hypothetical protein